MELPRTLQSWSAWLELFPREMTQSLGQMLQRLDRAVGPLRVRSETGNGEPDGFDGLSRRGSYERLLLTEWLLADEMPDEFLRRAVMGEHAFYQVARREPAGSRLSVALFDAGPSQLGSPRIAHIASLIVLSRRAEAAGAEFRWGVLQQRDTPLQTAAMESMCLLLEARSLREADAEDFTYWRERLGSAGSVDDFWVVGGVRLERLLLERRVSRLYVSDPVDTDQRCLTAAVHSPGRPSLDITLPLPEEKQCGRLLRDPFGTARSAPRRAGGEFAPTSNFVWAQNGTKLIARSSPNSLVVYSVPNSPSAGTGRPKIRTAKTEKSIILAAGRVQKATVSLHSNTNNFFVLDCIGGHHNTLPMGVFPDISTVHSSEDCDLEDSPLTPCFSALALSFIEPNVFALLPGNRLFEFGRKGDDQPFSRLVSSDVSMLAPVRESGNIVYAERGEGRWTLTSIGANDIETMEFSCDEDARDAFFGCGGTLEHPDFGMAALQVGLNEWVILTDENSTRLKVWDGQDVVGVIGPREYGKSPALLVLEDRRLLKVLGSDWSLDLPRANADIVQASASHANPYIAYATAAGEIVIYSVTHEADLYRLETGAQ